MGAQCDLIYRILIPPNPIPEVQGDLGRWEGHMFLKMSTSQVRNEGFVEDDLG